MLKIEQIKIFQFAFESQFTAISGYYMDLFIKQKFMSCFEESYKPFVHLLSEKSLTVLLSEIYNSMLLEPNGEITKEMDIS
jgi:hypothetical protein